MRKHSRKVKRSPARVVMDLLKDAKTEMSLAEVIALTTFVGMMRGKI